MKCPVCGGATSVLEKREIHNGSLAKRRLSCTTCEHRFNTFEIYEGLYASVKRHTPAHVKGVEKCRKLYARNQEILKRLLAGEKHASIASDYKLSDNMVSTIARRLGVPSKWQLKKTSGGRSIG